MVDLSVDSAQSLAKSKRRYSSGQIAIEYVLILIVAVTIAYTLVSFLVSRDPNSPGIIVQKWVAILDAVGRDLADSPAN